MDDCVVKNTKLTLSAGFLDIDADFRVKKNFECMYREFMKELTLITSKKDMHCR